MTKDTPKHHEIQSMPNEGKKSAIAALTVEIMNEPNHLKDDEHIPQVIIICPTHEICDILHKQCSEVYRGRYLVMKVHGDININSKSVQSSDCIICCPGRFVHEAGKIDGSELQQIIFYNYDQLMERGFLEDIEKILLELGLKNSRHVQVLGISNTVKIHDGIMTNNIFEKQVLRHVTRTYQIAKFVPLSRPKIFETAKIEHYVTDLSQCTWNHIEIIIDLMNDDRFKDKKIVLFCGSNEYVQELGRELRKNANHKRDIFAFGKWLFGDIDRNEKYEDIAKHRKLQRGRERASKIKQIKNSKDCVIVTTDVLSREHHFEADCVININLHLIPYQDMVNTYIQRFCRILDRKGGEQKYVYNLIRDEGDIEIIDMIQDAGNIQMYPWMYGRSDPMDEDSDLEEGEIAENEIKENLDRNNEKIRNVIREEKDIDAALSQLDDIFATEIDGDLNKLYKVLGILDARFKEIDFADVLEENIDGIDIIKHIKNVYGAYKDQYMRFSNLRNDESLTNKERLSAQKMMEKMNEILNDILKERREGFKGLVNQLLTVNKYCKLESNLKRNVLWKSQNEEQVLKEFEDKIELLEDKLKGILPSDTTKTIEIRQLTIYLKAMKKIRNFYYFQNPRLVIVTLLS